MRIAALLGLIAAGLPLHAANLLQNPGFETGGGETAAGWNHHVSVGEYEFSIAGGAHSGQRCLGVKCAGAAGCGRWYMTDLCLLAGATYHLSVWVKTEGGATAQIYLPTKSSGFDQVRQDLPEWTQVEGDFSVPDTGNCGLYLQNLGTGTVFYDDASVELTKAPPAQGGEPVPTDGDPIVGIVTPDSPLPHHAYLAAETRRILKAMTGAEPPVELAASVPAGDTGRRIWIGAAPPGTNYATKLALVGDEGIVLDIGPQAIACLGNTPRGEYYAVQELYHVMGCRWCWPGALGEVVPKVAAIELPSQLIVHRPSFDLRGGHFVQVYETPPDYSPKHVNTTEWVDWAARNRMNRLKASYPETWDYGSIRGGQVDEYSGHTLLTILPPGKWFATHPEYYPLVNGKRTATHSSGRPAEICVSNPDLPAIYAAAICDYFAAHESAKRYCVNAEDEPDYWCECDACKALDTVPIDWSKNGLEGLDLTDRWLTFINRVADLVAEKYPDRYVSTFAYASTHGLPHRVTPRRNVMIELCCYEQCFKHALRDPSCEMNVKTMMLFDGWSRLAPVALYRYLDYHHCEAPGCYQRSEADTLRTTYAGGTRFLSDEWDTTFNASPLLLNYRARLEWDVDTDLEAFTDDFCSHVYGKAAAEVARYFRRLDRAVLEAPTEHVTMNNLEKFTPEVVADCHALLDAAQQAAADDDDVLARIDRLRYSLLFAELDRATEAAQIDPQRYKRAAELQQRLWKIVQERELAPVMGYFGRLGTNYQPPLEAMTARRVMQLPEQWQFKTDPQSVGEPQEWFSASSDDTWKPIAIARIWEEQGYPGYDGDAWYTAEVDVPPVPEQRVWLFFEAVDETVKIWINGEYAGASEGDPNLLWDKPVAIDVTGKLRLGASNRITMRVHDIGGAGGIWKSAWITAND